jgi:hypothetical protein
MIPTANDFLGMLIPEENKQPSLGTIDSAYTSGRPKIIFDGETTASLKKYPYLDSYTPAANDRVLLLKVSGSYVIVGKIV